MSVPQNPSAKLTDILHSVAFDSESYDFVERGQCIHCGILLALMSKSVHKVTYCTYG